MLRLCIAGVLLASCWRGATPAISEPEPFVARIHALAELRAATDALPARLDIVEQRVLGLISETDRDAVRVDLAELADDIVTLRSYASSLRAQGADPQALDSIGRKLTHVSEAVAELRAELVYAHTLAEQHALAGQTTDGTDEPANAAPSEPGNAATPVRRRVLVRRPVTAEPLTSEPGLQDDSLVLPPLLRRMPVRRDEQP